MGNSDIVLQWSKLTSLTESEVKALSLNFAEGVYRISKKESDGKFYVVLVGSTLNLGIELLEILKKDFIKQDDDFSFRYAPVKGEDMRKAIEKQMYKQYVPRFNQTEPQSVLDVKVNLN